MSPAAARTSNEAIIAAARTLLESGGPDAVTMHAVADQVGVRPPSLYKRFADRASLMTALADDISADMTVAVAPHTDVLEPRAALRAMAARYRAFARRAPKSYQLLFATGVAPSPGPNALASADVLRLAGALAGPDQALEAARTLVAFAHGFVSMELAGAFRLGGDVDAAFDYGLETLIRGLAGRR